MNIDGLKKEAEGGDNRAMYYLAGTYFEMDDFKNAKKWLLKYIPKSDFHHERYEARILLSIIYLKDGSLDVAEKTLLGCFKDDVILNEHLILLGDIAYKHEAYHQAISYYRSASSFKLPDFFLILKEDAYTWLPWYKIAMCAMQTSDVALLKESIRKGKQYAPDRQEFFEMEKKLEEKFKMHNLKQKGRLYVVASLPIFIEPYLRELDKEYYVMFETKFNPEMAERADVIFCEWADHNAIAVSHFETKAKKIIRIHAYEVFSDFIDRINFYNVDQLIFVADHIKDYFMKRIEGWETNFKTTVIRNGIDLDKFQIAPNKKANNKIAWVGFISNKKGAVLLLHTAQSLPDYEFHVCGTFQERDVQQLFEKTAPKNMTVYPWQEDINRFFADKTYILNTSPREGCPVSVLEGMACGLKPLVYEWIGAIDFIGITWRSVDELKMLLDLPVNFKKYKEHVEINFDFQEKKQAIKNIIDYYMPITEEKDHARKNDQVAVQAS